MAAAAEGNCGEGREAVEDWWYDCWLEGRMLRVGDDAGCWAAEWRRVTEGEAGIELMSGIVCLWFRGRYHPARADRDRWRDSQPGGQAAR
jgi:hypothetical protein